MAGYKLMPKPRIDVNRIQLDVQRQREYQAQAKEDDQGITLKVNFLNPGEELEDLVNKPVSLEIIYEDILDAEKEVYNKINREYSHLLDGSKSDKERDLPRIIANLVSSKKLNIEEKRFIFNRVVNRYLGYGILQPLIADTRITEIACNSHDDIWAEIDGLLYKVGGKGNLYPEIQFPDPKSYVEYVQKLYSKTKRSLDPVDCVERAELPDGSRITANWVPVVRFPTINIRKAPDTTKRYTSKSFIETGAATEDEMVLLGYLVEGFCNIVFLGPTGSAKSTGNRIMIEEHTTGDRVIAIEDARELNPVHPHFVSLQIVKRDDKPVDYDDLIYQALSMRPERIIIHEMRSGKEASGFMKIINHGHDGITVTAHAKNPEDFISLMIVWLKESGMNIDENYIRKMLHDALDFLVFTRRLRDGSRKITSIWEVLPWDGKEFRFNKIFAYDFKAKKHIQCGKISQRTYMRCFENDVFIPEKFVESEVVKGD